MHFSWSSRSRTTVWAFSLNLNQLRVNSRIDRTNIEKLGKLIRFFAFQTIFFLQFQVISDTDTFILLQKVSNMLYYTNFGINFVLYCVTGQNFRKSLLGLLFPQTLRHQETTKVTGKRAASRVKWSRYRETVRACTPYAHLKCSTFIKHELPNFGDLERIKNFKTIAFRWILSSCQY